MEFEDLKRTPHSLEAEQSIIGSLIVDYKCMEDLAAILRPEHFYVDKYGRVYSEIEKMYASSAQIDFVTVLNQVLIRSGREEQAMLTTLAGLVVVLLMVVNAVAELFTTVKDLFGL